MAIVVNGERIEDAQIQKEVERLRPAYEKTFAGKAPEERQVELRRWSEDNLIEQVLFEQDLKNDQTPLPPGIIDKISDDLRKKFKTTEDMQKAFGTDEQGIRSLVERSTKERVKIHDIGNAAPPPSDGQIRQYYEQNKERFMASAEIHVAHIIIRLDNAVDEAAAIETMTQISAEIDGGVSLEQAAMKYEDAVDDLMDLGYIQMGQMPEEFDDVVFNLGPGQVSRVFRTRLGFHIAMVYDRRPPSVLPLHDVRQEIIDELSRQAHQDAVAAYLDALRGKAKIEYL